MAAGTYDSSRKRRNPKPASGQVQPPGFLKGEALAEWERTAPELIRLGLLTPLDRAAFVVYCVAWETYVNATTMLSKQGTVSRPQGKSKMRRRNPWVAIRADAVKTLRLAGERFGLDPFGRQRLDVASSPPGEVDPFEELMNRSRDRKDKARFFGTM